MGLQICSQTRQVCMRRCGTARQLDRIELLGSRLDGIPAVGRDRATEVTGAGAWSARTAGVGKLDEAKLGQAYVVLVVGCAHVHGCDLHREDAALMFRNPPRMDRGRTVGQASDCRIGLRTTGDRTGGCSGSLVLHLPCRLRFWQSEGPSESRHTQPWGVHHHILWALKTSRSSSHSPCLAGCLHRYT